MSIHLEVVFRGLEACPSLEALVRARTTLLRSTLSESIVACRVLVDSAIEQFGDGGRFRAFVEIMLPSGRRVASGGWTAAAVHHRPAEAIDEAFDAIASAVDSAPASVARRRTTTRMPALRSAG